MGGRKLQSDILTQWTHLDKANHEHVPDLACSSGSELATSPGSFSDNQLMN